MNDSASNRALAMFDDRASGMPVREFVEKYGRDGLFHLHQTDDACTKHKIETERAYALPFDQELLKVILSASNFSTTDKGIFYTVLHYVQNQCKECYGTTLDLYIKEDIQNA